MRCLVMGSLSLAAFFLPAAMRCSQSDNLMPQPAEFVPGEGRLVIDGAFQVALTGYQEPRLQAAATRFIARLHAQTAIPIAERPISDLSKAALVIDCARAGESVQSIKG